MSAEENPSDSEIADFKKFQRLLECYFKILENPKSFDPNDETCKEMVAYYKQHVQPQVGKINELVKTSKTKRRVYLDYEQIMSIVFAENENIETNKIDELSREKELLKLGIQKSELTRENYLLKLAIQKLEKEIEKLTE